MTIASIINTTSDMYDLTCAIYQMSLIKSQKKPGSQSTDAAPVLIIVVCGNKKPCKQSHIVIQSHFKLFHFLTIANGKLVSKSIFAQFIFKYIFGETPKNLCAHNLYSWPDINLLSFRFWIKFFTFVVHFYCQYSFCLGTFFSLSIFTHFLAPSLGYLHRWFYWKQFKLFLMERVLIILSLKVWSVIFVFGRILERLEIVDGGHH